MPRQEVGVWDAPPGNDVRCSSEPQGADGESDTSKMAIEPDSSQLF